MPKFSEHEKSKYWNYEKNDKNPEDFTYGSGKKAWFNCNKCKHTFECSIRNITSGGWCSYCSVPPKKLCSDNNCKECYNKSFASHEKSKYWSKDNIVKPRDVFKSTGKKYLFDCECGHEINITISGITGRDRFCSYCTNQQLCDDDCIACFNKSFASDDRSKYIIDKNLITRKLFKGTDKKYSFMCENGHKFDIELYRITSWNAWCPLCHGNKTEEILYKWLIGLYPNLIRQAKFEWCKNIREMPYDFYIPDKNILIELDGDQHFKDVKYWDSNYKEVQQRDAIKLISAIKNDMYVIHIYQPDVLYDKLNWKSILYYLIEYKSDDYFLSTIASDPKIYENYICEGISKLACDD